MRNTRSLFLRAAEFGHYNTAVLVNAAEVQGLSQLTPSDLDQVRRFAVGLKNKAALFTLEVRKEAGEWIARIDEEKARREKGGEDA